MFILCLCDSMSDSRKLFIIIKMCFSCIFFKYLFIGRFCMVWTSSDINYWLCIRFIWCWFLHQIDFFKLLLFIRFHEKKIILFSDWLIHTLLKFYNLHSRDTPVPLNLKSDWLAEHCHLVFFTLGFGHLSVANIRFYELILNFISQRIWGNKPRQLCYIY